MAFVSSTLMTIFNDFDGDAAEHDDWHSHEHLHERLSIPGFLRASRWAATGAGQAHMIMYEVTGPEVATSDGYLERLNDPTAWTSETMPRITGMTRGFCGVVASAGFGLGRLVAVLHFTPPGGEEDRLADRLAAETLPDLASRRGVVGAHLLKPAPRPPMTREQALRGQDNALPWQLFVMGSDEASLDRAAADCFGPETLKGLGADGFARYALQYTATAEEVARSPKPPVIAPEQRNAKGARL